MYKQYYADTLRLNALLSPGSRAGTWQISQTGRLEHRRCRGRRHRLQRHAGRAGDGGFEPRVGDLRRVVARAAVVGGGGATTAGDSSRPPRQQCQDLLLERIHDRHHAAAQTHPSFIPAAAERAADGRHCHAGDGRERPLGRSFALTATASERWHGTWWIFRKWRRGRPGGECAVQRDWVPAATGNYALTARATDNGPQRQRRPVSHGELRRPPVRLPSSCSAAERLRRRQRYVSR